MEKKLLVSAMNNILMDTAANIDSILPLRDVSVRSVGARWIIILYDDLYVSSSSMDAIVQQESILCAYS